MAPAGFALGDGEEGRKQASQVLPSSGSWAPGSAPPSLSLRPSTTGLPVCSSCGVTALGLPTAGFGARCLTCCIRLGLEKCPQEGPAWPRAHGLLCGVGSGFPEAMRSSWLTPTFRSGLELVFLRSEEQASPEESTVVGFSSLSLCPPGPSAGCLLSQYRGHIYTGLCLLSSGHREPMFKIKTKGQAGEKPEGIRCS